MVPWAVQLPINAMNITRHSLHVGTYCTKLSKQLNHSRRRYIPKKAMNTPVYSHNYHTCCYTEGYKSGDLISS